MNNLLNQSVSNAVKASLAYARDEWTREAQKELHSTRSTYLGGLSGVVMEEETKGRVSLSGKLPVMLEEGFPSYDMKTQYKNSPNVKRGKNGKWYLTIPFRHRTSGDNKAVMPKDILKEARKLKNREALKESIVRQLGYKPETSHTGYEWKNSKYDNMNRIIKESNKKISSQYYTYRRVGESSDPRSWIHPGYSGVKAAEKVAKKTERFLKLYLEENL